MLLPIFDRCYCQDIGWCYCLCIDMADVIAIIGRCYCQLCGRCWTTCILTFATSVMAGVIAWWQMEWPLQSDLEDVIAIGSKCYFSFSSEVLNRTSSHMWGRWYLPMFLLRDGLLTLIYNASLIVLLRFWSSLPTILKLSIVTWWPLMLLWSKIGEGAFWCSLNLSAKVLEDSPMYSSSQSTLPHLNL